MAELYRITITMDSEISMSPRETLEVEDYLSDKGYENIKVEQHGCAGDEVVSVAP